MSTIIIISINRNHCTPLKFYFWSSAVYCSAMPLAGLSFIKGLFIDPVFKITPKNNDESTLGVLECFFMVLLGMAAMLCSYIWYSPFSAFLLGQGIAYSSFPLYKFLCKESLLGKISRFVILIPGVLMIAALAMMWIYV